MVLLKYSLFVLLVIYKNHHGSKHSFKVAHKHEQTYVTALS